MRTIRVAQDFSVTPGGRYITDGPFSGEEFREKILVPAVDADSQISVILDGTRGYPSSFLDEAFAGLARKKGWNRGEFEHHIRIVAGPQYRIYADDIIHYVEKSVKK